MEGKVHLEIKSHRMKTLFKYRLALLFITVMLICSCKRNDNKPQDDMVNGSEITDSTETTTNEDYNTDGTTVAPSASNTNSEETGTHTSGSGSADPSALGPVSKSGGTGSGTSEGALPGGKAGRTDSTNMNRK